jgi:hypothetical protein
MAAFEVQLFVVLISPSNIPVSRAICGSQCMRESAFASGLYLEDLPPFEQCQMQSVEINILPGRPDKKAGSLQSLHT